MSGFHGGIDASALKAAGINPDDVKDFSVSINPAPLPGLIKDVIANSAIYRYPDSLSRELTTALAEEYGLPEDEILVVNGTSQAIYLLAAGFLSPGERAVVAAPAYGEYSDACAAVGAEVLEFRSSPESDFQLDAEGLIEFLKVHRPRLLWICSPNNPTGRMVDSGDRGRLARVCADLGCLMVLDEAYRCFAPSHMISGGFEDHTVHLRSMTKDFCIPGLRLGWVRAEPDVVRVLRRHQPDWSVSAPAQDAGTAALASMDYFRASWKETRRLTDELVLGLRELGLKPVPTAANFVLVKVGDDGTVKDLVSFLWKHLIQVRDCASFGLEGYIRLGTRSSEDNGALMDALGEFLE